MWDKPHKWWGYYYCSDRSLIRELVNISKKKTLVRAVCGAQGVLKLFSPLRSFSKRDCVKMPYWPRRGRAGRRPDFVTKTMPGPWRGPQLGPSSIQRKSASKRNFSTHYQKTPNLRGLACLLLFLQYKAVPCISVLINVSVCSDTVTFKKRFASFIFGPVRFAPIRSRALWGSRESERLPKRTGVSRLCVPAPLWENIIIPQGITPRHKMLDSLLDNSQKHPTNRACAKKVQTQNQDTLFSLTTHWRTASQWTKSMRKNTLS